MGKIIPNNYLQGECQWIERALENEYLPKNNTNNVQSIKRSCAMKTSSKISNH
jgi:hypothetical protein